MTDTTPHSSNPATLDRATVPAIDGAIQIEHLSKSYGATTVVDDLTFTVHPGTVTGFLGPNGAGKSTTMRMILGLDRPSNGRALIGGRPYAQWPSPTRLVGSLLDASAIHPGRTARAHLSWIARSSAVPASRIDTVLDRVGIADAADRPAGGLSLGMRQRLGLAGALLGDPRVLILDEPLNGLDPEGIVWLRHLLKDFAETGGTVLLSSHLMNEMQATADHVVVIAQGRLIADVSVAELAARTSGTIHVGGDGAAQIIDALAKRGGHVENADDSPDRFTVTGIDPAEINRIAWSHDVTLRELARTGASLETAFLTLTHDQDRRTTKGTTS
ncbi:ABC-2 type transport system ATP-binding protein [Microbacterium natoriense]|uniref:ABC-2 type transport system ATP-binding protein n=1 Tax=Microbacterium natoriense TaxID=284570 RepID=A0AAW8EUB7_9MICO|nr:ATP-binding cassette domain-containing protein [Microbacterium natoriense]MDQ0646504.1 ABC-2 type transport system ATP-binding protein [Microbacterium natoriense]